MAQTSFHQTVQCLFTAVKPTRADLWQQNYLYQMDCIMVRTSLLLVLPLVQQSDRLFTDALVHRWWAFIVKAQGVKAWQLMLQLMSVHTERTYLDLGSLWLLGSQSCIFLPLVCCFFMQPLSVPFHLFLLWIRRILMWSRREDRWQNNGSTKEGSLKILYLT